MQVENRKIRGTWKAVEANFHSRNCSAPKGQSSASNTSSTIYLSSFLLPYRELLIYTAMSRHAHVEEVYDDSDPEEVAPSDQSSVNFARDSILSGTGMPQPGSSSIPIRPAPELQRETPKHYQCLYPVYFDKTRSRAGGRKVGAELAVENPLARDIVDAVQMIGLTVGLEPEKLHPKDWANPGRVRVLLKQDGKLVNPKIKNSMYSSFYLSFWSFGDPC